jgi:hypothetical protein
MKRTLLSLALLCALASASCSEPGSASTGIPFADATFADTSCLVDGHCLAPTPVCDLLSSKCVGCVDDEDCKGEQTCSGNTCSMAGSCVPGTITCNGNDLWTCRPDGEGYDTMSCPSTCQEGICIECEPGATRCQDLNVEICVIGGSGWAHQEVCPEYCADGACISCLPGDTRCEGDLVQLCDPAGAGWLDYDDCATKGGGLSCFHGVCIDPCSDDFKFNTNMGCEYWAVDLDQTSEGGSDNSPFAIVVSNPGTTASTTVTLSKNGAEIESREVAPQELHIFNLDPHNVDGTMQAQRAYRIKATRPIIAYQFNPLENVGVFSNDASMLIPQNSLGTAYRVLGWPERTGELRAYVTIVGSEVDTQVTFTSTANTRSGGGVPALSPGGVFTTTLQPYEVLSIETNGTEEDLTGSFIEASKPVAVFSGHECANVPYASACTGGTCASAPQWSCSSPNDCPVVCCCDHLEEQLIPISAWGKTYIGARSYRRNNEPDYWRVVASVDLTTVSVNPPVAGIPTLMAGEVYEFKAIDSFVLSANQPVLVGQFLASEHAPDPYVGTCGAGIFPGFGACTHNSEPCFSDSDCSDTLEIGDAGVGDPAFILSVPIEQLRDDYVFLAPNKYASDYLSIYAQTDTSITLDGQSIDGQDWKAISGDWRQLTLLVQDGVHRMAGTAPFGVMVHGFDEYVSYGYPAGMNVTNLAAP